jgi:hypothetical protein
MWSVALLRGYENSDELVNDVFLDSIGIFPDGAMTLTMSNGVSRLGSREKE